MNPVPASMSTMLGSRFKDLLCAIEFYLPTYTPHVSRGFEPGDAEALFATETATFTFNAGNVTYQREIFEMPSLTRNMGKQSNSVTVKLSNVPKSATPTIRPLALFVLNNEVEGMRMVIRLISRAKLLTNEFSWVLFVGKCLKADGFDRKDGSITAKQDLGQIEAMIPPQVFQKDCPLDFGGVGCLGTELLTAKNAAYQTAFATLGRRGCNKTHGDCTTFENTEFFQGIRVLQLPGSFVHKPHMGLFGKILTYGGLGLLGRFLRPKSKTVGSSLEDGTPYGRAVPVVLGRWQMDGIPLQYRDDGETVHFKMGLAGGPISNFYNIRVNDPAFVNPPVTVVGHYGRYGGEADQLADTVFPDASFHSRLAYITGGVVGSPIEVEDPVPPISAIVAGSLVWKVTLFLDSIAGQGTTDSVGDYSFVSSAWSDNPVDLVAFLLIDDSYLGLGQNGFDENRTAKTSVYTLGAIKDETNAERLVLPDTETGRAGVDYNRYNSTGLIKCSGSALSAITGPMFAGPNLEVDYEFYDPDAPPASVAQITKYRKRYTYNGALTEQKKVVDFINDTLLPTFRGFLSWDTFGRVGIRSERPADSSHLYAASVVGATTIKVQDVQPWKQQLGENNIPLIGKVLIGVGLVTSEVRPVISAAYTADGNSITLAASASGSIVATPSSGTFTGGSASVQATGTIQISGSFAVGDTVTATINGIPVVYTLEGSGFNAFKVANCLAFAINADRALQKYVVAHCPVLDDTVHIYSKQGVLTVAALVNAHDIDEETIRVMMSFAGQAANFTAANVTVANILDGTFGYDGPGGQTRYNQFKGTFHDPLRDFAEQNVIINDYEHQETNALKPLEIDLSGVDNFNQASRLLNGAASKHGDLTEFFSWASNGLALQLEEGDVVCVSDTSGGFINQPVRIENLTVNSKYEVSFKARQYSTSAYDDFVEQTDVPLVQGTGFANPPAAITFNTVDFPPNGLVQSTDGTAGITSIRGGAIFPTRRNATYAFVRLIKRAGVTVNEQVGIIYPDDNLEAVFEFIASADGLYTVELEVCNQWRCNTTKPTADIIIGFGSLFGIATESGILITTEGGTFIEQEH